MPLDMQGVELVMGGPPGRAPCSISGKRQRLEGLGTVPKFPRARRGRRHAEPWASSMTPEDRRQIAGPAADAVFRRLRLPKKEGICEGGLRRASADWRCCVGPTRRVAVTPGRHPRVERITNASSRVDHSAQAGVGLGAASEAGEGESGRRACGLLPREPSRADKGVKGARQARASPPRHPRQPSFAKNQRERVAAAFRTGEIRQRWSPTDHLTPAAIFLRRRISHVVKFSISQSSRPMSIASAAPRAPGADGIGSRSSQAVEELGGVSARHREIDSACRLREKTAARPGPSRTTAAGGGDPRNIRGRAIRTGGACAQGDAAK